MPNPKDPTKFEQYRKKQSENAKERWKNPAYRKRMIEAIKKVKQNPLHRKKLSLAQKKAHPVDPKKHETKKCPICGEMFSEYKSNHRIFCSRKCYKVDFTNRHAKKFSALGVQKRKQILQRMTKKEREEYIKKLIIPTGQIKPTSLERKMKKIIQKYHLSYKYVGDFSFMIERKNPDFINTNGQKICIEVRHKDVCKYLDKITPQQYVIDRGNSFKKYGWHCLVFFNDDLEEEEDVISKIRIFENYVRANYNEAKKNKS